MTCVEDLLRANLTRWSPFKALSRFEQGAPFDDFFRGFNLRPQWSELEAPDVRIDVTENDAAYRVKAEMPGVDKSDIDVSISGNQVAISAEVKRESKKKDDERDICTERYYGQVYRSFSLPDEVDSDKATARYEGGVLTLELPKKGNGSARKLTIS
jgi:HSP20 family protein